MTNKINNQERIKKVAIIPNNNFYKLEPFIKCDNRLNRDSILEFIYASGIELPIGDIYLTSEDNLIEGLVKLGFSILFHSGTNEKSDLTIYLPEQLTDEQKQYLKFATSLLSNCTLMVFSHNTNDEVFDYQKEASSNPENFINYVNGFPTYTKSKQENNNKLVRKPE